MVSIADDFTPYKNLTKLSLNYIHVAILCARFIPSMSRKQYGVQETNTTEYRITQAKQKFLY